jgi:hypothetical protein
VRRSARAVANGLFTVGSGAPRLIGSRCRSCGATYFPQAFACRNPHGGDREVDEVVLPERGTLRSYTVQRYRPPPLFRMDDWAPYAIGLVDLGEGLQVMAMLTGIPLDALRIDMLLTLVVEPLYRDDDGVDVLTFKFAPTAEDRA